MTFYEWIRACLLKDAEQHPYPGRFLAPDPSSGEEREDGEEPDRKGEPP